MDNRVIFLGILALFSSQAIAKESAPRQERENHHARSNTERPKRFSLSYIDQSLTLPDLAHNEPPKDRQDSFFNCHSAKNTANSKR